MQIYLSVLLTSIGLRAQPILVKSTIKVISSPTITVKYIAVKELLIANKNPLSIEISAKKIPKPYSPRAL